jgi:hypothetical protein
VPDESTLFGRILFKIFGVFEPICSKQQLIALMREAGFSEVRELSRYR